jgi:hypothetical protein
VNYGQATRDAFQMADVFLSAILPAAITPISRAGF